MSENAEATEKAAKKTTKKKAAAKKAAPKKPAKKAAAVKQNVEAPAKKRGRPAGKKTGRPASKKAGKRRGKKPAKQFAYMLLTRKEDDTMQAGALNGPFASEKDALDDASLMSDEKTDTTVVIFRESKRGKVQRQTKFVVGR